LGNCGQVGERGSCPLTEVTHVLRPAEKHFVPPLERLRHELCLPEVPGNIGQMTSCIGTID
jgi:hypothetical protein